MSQLIKEAWRGVFRGGKHGQNGLAVATTVIKPSSAKDALTIPAQHREATRPARSE
jgi:hypothetical protein